MARKTGIVEAISLKAVELLEKEFPNGLRFSELKTRILEEIPGTNPATIEGTLVNLVNKMPAKVERPTRGFFKYLPTIKAAVPSNDGKTSKNNIREEEFYEPFADYIVNDLEDCTKAITLGGSKFRGKWATPDVIGIRKSKHSDIIQAPIEVISAEIKMNTNDLITAFGQACSYRLFSHKSYLVIPQSSAKEDIDRIESLCFILGIGLILFDNTNPKEPNFDIRTRSLKIEPDLFYANKYLKEIEDDLVG